MKVKMKKVMMAISFVAMLTVGVISTAMQTSSGVGKLPELRIGQMVRAPIGKFAGCILFFGLPEKNNAPRPLLYVSSSFLNGFVLY